MLEDVVSKKDEVVETLLCTILIIQLYWVVEEMEELKNDQRMCVPIQMIQKNLSDSDNFLWKDDLLCYKYWLHICKNSQLKQKVLLKLHTSPIEWKLGFLRTYNRIKKELFYEYFHSIL